MRAHPESVRLLVLDENPFVRRFIEHVARPHIDASVISVDTPVALVCEALERRAQLDLVICDTHAARLDEGSTTLAALSLVTRIELTAAVITDRAFQGYVPPEVLVLYRPVQLSLVMDLARNARRARV